MRQLYRPVIDEVDQLIQWQTRTLEETALPYTRVGSAVLRRASPGDLVSDPLLFAFHHRPITLVARHVDRPTSRFAASRHGSPTQSAFERVALVDLLSTGQQPFSFAVNSLQNFRAAAAAGFDVKNK